MPARLTRRGRLVVSLTALLAVLVAGWLLLTRTPLGAALGFGQTPPCALGAATGELRWSRSEAMTATTVAGVGSRIGATENGVAAAVRRSLAVERETPPTPAEARQVYRRLPDVARPGAEALAVARALLGGRPGALTCVVPLGASSGVAAEDPGHLGLTPRADLVRREMRRVFGKQILGGFAPQGVSSGHVGGSAHYDGRAIDVFFRPVTAAGTRRGWQQAMWLTAHAERLHVATVIFDRQIWSAARSVQGWRTYRYPGGATDDPVLLHEDHVHVDVAAGA